MANPEHVALVQQGAAAIRKWREEHPEHRLELSEADLPGADLPGAKLARANLAGANLSFANLDEADLSLANLAGANLVGAKLAAAKLVEATLANATLANANMRRATLQQAVLYEADLSGADLTQVVHAAKARRLETVRLASGDAHYFDTCIRSWPEHRFDWERLRTVGRLPLFGASYTALILIPIVFYGLALYNDKVARVHDWAGRVTTVPDHPLHWVAVFVLEHLQPHPLPKLSFFLLISTVLLAIGATLYTFFCPSRVKEFSRDQWCDQLGRSLLHYWPLAWKYCWIRLACAAAYVLGGLGVLCVICSKVWGAARFILANSVFPWPWR